MEGSEAGTMGVETAVMCAGGFPHDSQRLRADCDSAGAGERTGNARATLIAATVEVLAASAPVSDPRLIETGVTRMPAWILGVAPISHTLPTPLGDCRHASPRMKSGPKA
jgi:hypothetical protein